MHATRALKRAMTIGGVVTAVLIGSTFVQPTAPVSAAVLPHASVGTPDTGYPCPTCAMSAGSAPAPAGDIGYPTGCGFRACGFQDRPAPSGDIGYPGYPSCSSTLVSQPDQEREAYAGWS